MKQKVQMCKTKPATPKSAVEISPKDQTDKGEVNAADTASSSKSSSDFSSQEPEVPMCLSSEAVKTDIDTADTLPTLNFDVRNTVCSNINSNHRIVINICNMID